MSVLDILYSDGDYVAIYKPADMSVHRGDLSGERDVAMTLLRNQLGQHVWPLHRLDRPTAGVLLFATSSENAEALNAQFRERQVHKTYLALVRGWTQEASVIDYALAAEKGATAKQAISHYRRLAKIELPIPMGKFPTSRYALVRVTPETGRYHQIRKHFHHISHHLIGDTVHGDGKHNRLFRQHFHWHRLCLLAESLQFTQPRTGKLVALQTRGDGEWQGLLNQLGVPIPESSHEASSSP